MGDEGIEHPPLSLSKTAISQEGDAESDAHNAPTPIQDPDLAQIVAAWSALPEHIKAAVLALVQVNSGR